MGNDPMYMFLLGVLTAGIFLVLAGLSLCCYAGCYRTVPTKGAATVLAIAAFLTACFGQYIYVIEGEHDMFKSNQVVEDGYKMRDVMFVGVWHYALATSDSNDGVANNAVVFENHCNFGDALTFWDKDNGSGNAASDDDSSGSANYGESPGSRQPDYKFGAVNTNDCLEALNHKCKATKAMYILSVILSGCSCLLLLGMTVGVMSGLVAEETGSSCFNPDVTLILISLAAFFSWILIMITVSVVHSSFNEDPDCGLPRASFNNFQVFWLFLSSFILQLIVIILLGSPKAMAQFSKFKHSSVIDHAHGQKSSSSINHI